MNKVNFFAIILLMILLTALLPAQSRFQAGAHFSLAFPQNEFGKNVKNTGIGGDGHFLYNFPNSNIAVGAGLNFYVYGSETRSGQFSPLASEVKVDVNTSNNILAGFLMMRLQSPQDASVKPYLLGLLGFNYLFTETKISDADDWGDDDEDIASTKNYEDTALCYGGGAGLSIRVYDGRYKENSGLKAVNIDFGTRFILGDEAEYLKKGDIERINDQVIYHPSKSTTDLWTFQLGVTFDF
jgi:hypothetical protein